MAKQDTNYSGTKAASYAKKSLAATLVVSLSTVLLLLPNTMQGAGEPTDSLSSAEQESLATMEKRRDELEQKDALTPEEDAELMELVRKIGIEQINNGTYDYKADFETQLSTLDAVVADNAQLLKSTPKDDGDYERIKDNNERVERIADKYHELAKSARTQQDYKRIDEQLEKEIRDKLDGIVTSM